WGAAEAAPIAAEAVGTGECELLWANMTLHWCADPAAELRRWHAALAVDGLLMFSTLGPGTLQGLRELYRAHGWGSPHVPFVDMHDLGDMLVEAGFADPVMDQETLTLTWRDAAAMRAELRTLGANVDPARHAGLRTPRWREALAQALASSCRAGGEARAALGFEIVYGHAWRPAPRPRVAAETAVGLDEMRSILRRRPDH
ncbi:MAG: biotin synthase, partial [Burkholderiales bacterium]|nr:biotin synthase [Burkholderiales bacterium]